MEDELAAAGEMVQQDGAAHVAGLSEAVALPSVRRLDAPRPSLDAPPQRQAATPTALK